MLAVNTSILTKRPSFRQNMYKKEKNKPRPEYTPACFLSIKLYFVVLLVYPTVGRGVYRSRQDLFQPAGTLLPRVAPFTPCPKGRHTPAPNRLLCVKRSCSKNHPSRRFGSSYSTRETMAVGLALVPRPRMLLRPHYTTWRRKKPVLSESFLFSIEIPGGRRTDSCCESEKRRPALCQEHRSSGAQLRGGFWSGGQGAREAAVRFSLSGGDLRKSQIVAQEGLFAGTCTFLQACPLFVFIM